VSAFELAEKGNATMRRRVLELQIATAKGTGEDDGTVERMFIDGVEVPLYR
jgi:hypothetical protein